MRLYTEILVSLKTPQSIESIHEMDTIDNVRSIITGMRNNRLIKLNDKGQWCRTSKGDIELEEILKLEARFKLKLNQSPKKREKKMSEWMLDDKNDVKEMINEAVSAAVKEALGDIRFVVTSSVGTSVVAVMKEMLRAMDSENKAGANPATPEQVTQEAASFRELLHAMKPAPQKKTPEAASSLPRASVDTPIAWDSVPKSRHYNPNPLKGIYDAHDRFIFVLERKMSSGSAMIPWLDIWGNHPGILEDVIAPNLKGDGVFEGFMPPNPSEIASMFIDKETRNLVVTFNKRSNSNVVVLNKERIGKLEPMAPDTKQA